MTLDSATLLIVSTLISIMLGALWVGLSLDRQRTPGLCEWGLALISAGLGSLVLGLRGLAPDWVSIDAGNALILLATGFAWVGARRFDGRPAYWWMLLLTPLIWLIARRLPVMQPLEARIFLTSLLAAPVMLACAVEFLRSRAESPAFRRLLAASFALHATLILMRVPAVLIMPEWSSSTGLPTHPLFQLILLESLLHGVVTSFALMVLFRERGERRAMAGIAAARDEAERANAAKSRFMARMSHELRTPLNGVLGLSDALAARRDLPPPVREQVQVIGQAGRHLLALVNDILDIGMVEAGRVTLHRGIVPLRPLLEDAMALLSPEAERKRLELRLEVDPGCPAALEGDARRLRQILLNLLGNAVKFTPEAGRASLAARPGLDGGLVLEITDNGPGIPRAQRALLFREFTRLMPENSSAEGHGLGLAITARLVSAMGGSIGYEDGPDGTGSQFWVRLNLPEAKLPEPAEMPAAAVGPARRILVVDDVAVNRLVVQALLQGSGHEVQQAESGEAALSLLERQGLDLILLDVQMPGLGGLETARLIRAAEAADPTRPRLAILALTGSDGEEEHEACRAAGMDGVLVKPMGRTGLLAAIRGAAVSPPAGVLAD
ncbi:ATP-binding protein [Pseudoroseomonas globiformis]|uniref:histidine kinase n=1 Tax=Teichococcus globiformis TaxID=2307229 RepID=A0ABV7G4S1_9PROT